MPVVFDGIGKDAWEMSLASLAPRGLMVTFGNASGKVPPFDINRLSAMGSLYVTRPTLMTYTADSGEMRKSANDLFKKVINGDAHGHQILLSFRGLLLRGCVVAWTRVVSCGGAVA